MEEVEYEELDELFGSNEEISLALSFSRISDYDRNGPKALDKRTVVDGLGVRIGSVVDDWLFNRDNFEDMYYIFNGEKPTATLGKLVDIILKNYVKIPNKKEVLRIIEKNNFWKRSKVDTLVKYFDTPEFWGYLTAMFKAREKVLVTTSDMLLGRDLANVLETHEYSSYLFRDIEGIESAYQWKFNLVYNETKIRGIIDMVKVDHNNKTVRFIDLKTGQAPAMDFMGSFLKYRYFFQAGIYTLAFEEFCKEFKLEGYKLLRFQFLYIGRKEQLPLVYTVSDKWIKAAFDGFTTIGGYEYRGVNELIDEIKWHWNNKIFNIPKDVYENNGKLMLKDDFFNLK